MWKLSRLHRWSGLIACLGLLLWGSSGLLHPLMSRLQPQPAQRQAPLPALPAQELTGLWANHGITAVRDVQRLSLNGRDVLRVSLPQRTEALYLALDSGELLPDGEAEHARFLARHFSGDAQSTILSLQRVAHFSPEYPAINRYLPVWQVRFDRPDGLRVHVDTAGNRLGSQTNSRQVALSGLFHQLHTWAWAERLGPLRPWLMTLLLTAALLTTVLGLNLALRRPGGKGLQRQALRRWHRHAALLVSCTTLSFAVSGLYHLWQKAGLPTSPPPLTPVFSVEELPRLPALVEGEHLSLLRLDDRAYWRIAEPPPARRQGSASDNHAANAHGTAQARDSHPHHGHHAVPQAQPENTPTLHGARFFDTRRGQPAPDTLEARYAEVLARHFSGLATDAVTGMKTVTGFGPDYGFVNKRLPVVAVSFDTAAQDRWFVQTTTGELAAWNHIGHRREAWIFANLHKWHFLNINPAARDALQAAFALGNVLVALLGFCLFLRLPRQARAQSTASPRPTPT